LLHNKYTYTGNLIYNLAVTLWFNQHIASLFSILPIQTLSWGHRSVSPHGQNFLSLGLTPQILFPFTENS